MNGLRAMVYSVLIVMLVFLLYIEYVSIGVHVFDSGSFGHRMLMIYTTVVGLMVMLATGEEKGAKA